MMGDFSFENMQGAPIIAASIVLVAVILMGGFAIGFQGAVHF